MVVTAATLAYVGRSATTVTLEGNPRLEIGMFAEQVQ